MQSHSQSYSPPPLSEQPNPRDAPPTRSRKQWDPETVAVNSTPLVFIHAFPIKWCCSTRPLPILRLRGNRIIKMNTEVDRSDRLKPKPDWARLYSPGKCRTYVNPSIVNSKLDHGAFHPLTARLQPPVSASGSQMSLD